MRWVVTVTIQPAINIRNNKYLNYRNYTRGVEYDDGEDLISLVQYNKNIDFANAMKISS